MCTIKRLFQEAKAVMTRFRMGFVLNSTVAHLVQVSILILMLFPHVAVSQIDTSEESMIKHFQRLISNSETIVDAQVISKESWLLDSSDARNYGWRHIGRRGFYTTIKFKVFQTIKGNVENNEFTFDQEGGKIGATSQVSTNQIDYKLNERAIYFFGKKDKYGELWGVMYEIYKPERVGGGVRVGDYILGANGFINALKQSVTDTEAFRKYYHNAKNEEENFHESMAKWLRKGLKDTVKQKNPRILKDNNINDGGMK
ncbi:MAG: hypothetical protein ABSA44_10910 [Bacteroidota bacterium]|jgi:hypothetical protein